MNSKIASQLETKLNGMVVRFRALRPNDELDHQLDRTGVQLTSRGVSHKYTPDELMDTTVTVDTLLSRLFMKMSENA